MGPIHYTTSDYITIGYNCNNIDYDEEDITYYIDDLYDSIHCLLAQQYFYYFHVTLNAGYYEGFYIDIEHNFNYCYDNYEEKRAALKEITKIKNFLLSCVNDFECCAVSPGWCMTYYNYSETLKKINEAIKEMRETVKSTPTWARLPKSEKYA